jgi:hypothetical protein
MSTWLTDLKKSNPLKAADYAMVGNQDKHCLRNMVKALESMPALNTQDDNNRLAAAKRILCNG